MNLQQFLLILQARYKAVILTLIGTVAVTLALSLMLPKQYTATASVVVDVKSPDPIAGVMLPAMVMPSYMATQVDIINSDRVAQGVVKKLKLDQVPQLREQWMEDTDGKGKIEVWIAPLLQKKLEVKPSRESNMISIGFKAGDPAFAAAVANAFAQTYIDTTIELKVQPARQYARWFGEQGKTLRDDVERAQKKLSEYQQAHGIVANDERLDNETAKLNELSSQLTTVQGQTSDAQSKQNSGAASESLPEVLQNPLIVSLKSDVARQEAKLQEIAGNVGKNHPQFQRAQMELASLKQKLDAETRMITSGFMASKNVGKNKEAELRASIEAQKKKLLDLKRERDELSVLTRDLDSAQKAYEAVTQRFNATRLESQATQTNVSILAQAEPPIDPSFPLIVLNTVLSVFLGTLLGIASAFMLEMVDQRVRSGDEVAEVLQLPVLGDIPKLEKIGGAVRRWRTGFGFGRRRVSLATE